MRPSFLIGALVVAIAIIGVIQFWPVLESAPERAPAAQTVPATEPEQPAPRPTAPEPTTPATPLPADSQPAASAIVEPAIALPQLAASDAFVRDQVEAWRLPETWLQPDDLLARAAVIVLNAAEGRVPRRQVAFLTPAESFPVVKVGTGIGEQQDEERFLVDPAGFARYDGYVDVLEAIPPGELAAFVHLVTPLLSEALALLGERRAPEDLLLATVERLDALPAVSLDAPLVRPNVMYLYADPGLEGLPEFDKQMLRMGPRNVSRIRAYVSEFKRLYLLK